MPDWRDYLEPIERARLIQIAGENRDIKREYRRIYDRCRKRMATARVSK